MSNDPKFYPLDAQNAYPEPVGTLDRLEHSDGAVWVHLNGKRSKLVGLQSLAFLISNLQTVQAEVFGSAEQHQGEPVTLPMRRSWSGIASWRQQAEVKAWNACLDEIAKLGPLYTHADAGEVVALRSAYLRASEREHNLRTQLHQLNTAFNEWVDKSQWARKGAVADELGMHLADVINKRYDQLQSDLNARDQRIDQLEQQPRVPDGFALVPQSMLLSKEVIGVINFHCGDTDQEEGGQFGQYTDGRLWVGYVLDDDGRKVHGLHIATDEYPEEGSTTLIEFPEPGAEQKPKECGACGGCTNGCHVDKDSPKAASVGAQVAALMESRGES